jgi:antitoxin component YwqK of YwqJK toxin-antitoxin module
MKKSHYILLLILYCTICFSQDEKILYVVDSIPILEEPKEGFGTLSENEIDNVTIIKEKEKIKEIGYENIDALIYIFTKEYANRSDSIKSIPSTYLMTKRNDTWYLKNNSKPYSGPFIDYYVNGKKQGEGFLAEGKLKGKRLIYFINGNISDEITYENGIANGIEKRFFKDGTLMQKGTRKNGKEIDVWEMYHQNGKLKQRSTFENGKMSGESISYYSTGEINGISLYQNGVYQNNKTTDKLYKLYQEAQNLYNQFDIKSAIKKLDKALEINPNWAEGYFSRGTMKMNNLDFDEAIKDFDKTVEIEPCYAFAYANRGFAILRKHEFGNSRTISKSKDVQVFASKKTEIPESDLVKICQDLNQAVLLGDENKMVLDALEKNCKK